jgi:hypothetical protein
MQLRGSMATLHELLTTDHASQGLPGPAVTFSCLIRPLYLPLIRWTRVRCPHLSQIIGPTLEFQCLLLTTKDDDEDQLPGVASC